MKTRRLQHTLIFMLVRQPGPQHLRTTGHSSFVTGPFFHYFCIFKYFAIVLYFLKYCVANMGFLLDLKNCSWAALWRDLSRDLSRDPCGAETPRTSPETPVAVDGAALWRSVLRGMRGDFLGKSPAKNQKFSRAGLFYYFLALAANF